MQHSCAPEKSPLKLEVQHERGLGSQMPSLDLGPFVMKVYASVYMLVVFLQPILKNQGGSGGPAADWLRGLCKHMCLE